MAKTMMTRGALCLLAGCTVALPANAGGFSRGNADTAILYEDGDVVFRGGVIYVNPDRKYATINGVRATDDSYTNSFAIPNFAAKFAVSDAFSCAATYTQPFGADSSYGPQAQAADALTSAIGNATIHAKFKTEEYGATCAVRFDLEKGRINFLGGVFLQSFDYTEVTRAGTLRLEDSSELGYRLGAAYEIPDIALRAEVLYRSQVDHDATGTFTASGSVLPFPAGFELDAYGSGSLPQSLELNLQSGIAPGWLAFGSVKWTDWSVLPALNYNIDLLGPQRKNFVFQDGWTIMGGVGHAFNDKVSGAVSLTWDRGVGTGADIMTDTWTVGVGASIKGGPGELRLGGAVSYLTSGSQRISGNQLADYNATADGDWAYALSASYKIKF